MNHETNLVPCGIAIDATRNDGDEEIYGGEISVLDRSWAKEINHMLYVSVREIVLCDPYQAIQNIPFSI